MKAGPAVVMTVVVIAVVCLLPGCGGSEPVLRWEPTGGPTAQNISALLADEKVPGAVFAGLTNGDIYFSPDLGTRWSMLHRASLRKRIHALVQHPEDAARIFAAAEGGLFVSSNGGKEWVQLRIDPGSDEQSPCRSLAIDPWTPAKLYAGLAGRGLYHSADGGRTWTPLLLGTNARLSLSTVTGVAIDPSRPDVLYAAIDGAGVFRSADAGRSWTPLTSDAGTESPACLLVHRSDSRSILFATATGAFFKTSDGGETWSQTAMVTGGGRVLTLGDVPTNHDLAYAGTENGIMRSTDFGGTWLDLRSSLPSSPTSVMVTQDRSRACLFAFGGGIGVQRSTDNGVTWTHADDNLGGATVSRITATADGTRILGVVGGTIFQHDAASNTWISAGSGLRGGAVTSICFDEQSASVIYAATPGGLFRTTTGGSSWESFARTLPSSPRLIETHPFYKNRLFASGESGLFYSTNSGRSWSQARPADQRHLVNSLTFTPTNAGLIHAATEDAGVLQSANGGISWEDRRYGLKNDNIQLVTLDSDDPRTLYAWTPKGECYRSTNLGAEWNRYSVPWAAGAGVVLSMDKGSPHSVVALVDGREIYHSSSGGNTWRLLLQRGPSFRAATIYWNEATMSVFLGTQDSGVFRIDLSPYFQEESDRSDEP